MNYLTLFIALSALVSLSSGSELNKNSHYYTALEWDVESPQDSPCATERGFFGRSAKFSESYKFTYEVELLDGEYLSEAMVDTQRGGQPPEALQGVFSAIETRIADTLLKSEVFSSVCSGGIARGPFRGNGDQRRLGNTQREMRAVGISSAPDDLILEGLSCQSVSANETGLCMVVDGEFVVYLDIYQELDAELDFILSNLMNERKELDDAHPYIEKVRYVSLSADGVQTDGIEKENGGGVQSQGNNSTLSGSFYALIAAGSFIIVGTAIFYRRRRRNADHDGETTTLDPASRQ